MRHFYSIEILLMILYKFIFDFFVLPIYLSAYGYMFFYQNAEFTFSIGKYFLSTIAFCWMLVFLFKMHKKEEQTYLFLIRVILLITVIPSLSVYAFMSNTNYIFIIYPLIFFTGLFFLLKIDSSKKKNIEIIKLPKFNNIDIIMLAICGGIAVIIWLMMDMPIVTTFDDAVEQRLALRAEEMPKLLSYIHTFLGGVVFPYLFAKFIEKKKYMLALLSLVFGYMAFSVNGMKTWIFLYLLFFLILILTKVDKGNFELRCIYTELACIAIAVASILIYKILDVPTFLGQFGRMFIVPPTIGYKSVDFFSQNELLYLRESFLRFFSDSPYPNGSDFYIFYGNNATITSGRSNCGLWSDAFRNFGMLGILIYPFFYEKIFHIVIRNGEKLTETMKNFILLLIFWNAINLSYFTWLLTGGVIVMIMLEKIDSGKKMMI